MKIDAGLTLVEVLVAMAILGIVLALITNWQTQTLQLTTSTSAQAQQLADLNDVTGYIGDRVRAAVRVRVATSGLTVNTGTGNACSASSPCLAVVIPEGTAAGALKYVLYVYRMQARSVVSSDDKLDDTWAEDNVQVLREYRSADTASTPINCVPGAGATFETSVVSACATMRNLDTQTSLTGFQPFLIADYLTPSDALPGGVTAFSWLPASRSVTVNVQSLRRVRGVSKTLPAASAYTLTVQGRNLP